FGNVSHEFRTPLTLILGPVEDLLEGAAANLSPAHQQQVQVLHRNALRLLKLVNSLLDFSRLEAGRMEALFQPTDLSAFTIDLASTFRSAIERAGMRLEVSCPPLADPVFVDQDMWEKIVLNLLSNAFKYTLHGSIRVALTLEGTSVVLAVSDTGTGIPAEALPRLFERFYRVQGVYGRTHEGTGIGLALVQELVRLHGGTVQVSSTWGEGSTFTVRIPCGAQHLSMERLALQRPRASVALGAQPYVEEALRWLVPGDAPPAVGAPSTPDAPGLRAPENSKCILVADDNADMRDYVRRLLSGTYRVLAAADGEAALQAIRTLKPDLVVADLMMPRIDGLTLLRRLRADPALSTTPVILLSARAGEEA
ncbi:MAG TPA: ATP-binding protein, partial [Myxococcota bacterium]|nr:ATP-binding protein [Myxococcota bacterium]